MSLAIIGTPPVRRLCRSDIKMGKAAMNPTKATSPITVPGLLFGSGRFGRAVAMEDSEDGELGSAVRGGKRVDFRRQNVILLARDYLRGTTPIVVDPRYHLMRDRPKPGSGARAAAGAAS